MGYNIFSQGFIGYTFLESDFNHIFLTTVFRIQSAEFSFDDPVWEKVEGNKF